MSLENSIQTNILDYLNGLSGCIAENESGNAGQKGRADITACYKGRCYKIEVKSEETGYKATKIQRLKLKRWARAGAYCLIVYSVDDVKAFINSEDIFHKEQFHGEFISC